MLRDRSERCASEVVDDGGGDRTGLAFGQPVALIELLEAVGAIGELRTGLGGGPPDGGVVAAPDEEGGHGHGRDGAQLEKAVGAVPAEGAAENVALDEVVDVHPGERR